METYNGYIVNGFRFHTEAYGENRSTCNYGVYIKGSNNNYYGVLKDIIELEFQALPIKRTVLFMVDWFDPTMNTGMIIHTRYQLVDIQERRRFNRYEPFALAAQASQVYFCKYPGSRRHN